MINRIPGTINLQEKEQNLILVEAQVMGLN